MNTTEEIQISPSDASVRVEGVDRHALLLLFLCSAVTLVNCVGTASSAKIIALPFSLTASVSVITYIANFMLTDITNELYGRERASLLKHLALFTMFATVGITQLYVAIPPAQDWNFQREFAITFEAIPRILGAGIVAFYVGQSFNIEIFSQLAKRKPTWPFYRRKLICDIVSHVPDTLIFVSFAFFGTSVELRKLVLGQFTVKVALTLVYLPVSQVCLVGIRYYLSGFI